MIMTTLYWCPHQVLKATGMPDNDLMTATSMMEIQLRQKITGSVKNTNSNFKTVNFLPRTRTSAAGNNSLTTTMLTIGSGLTMASRS